MITEGKWGYKQSRGNNLYEYRLFDKDRNIFADIEFTDKREAEANARLIAAAPDLLAVCKYTCEKMKDIKGKAFSILPIIEAIAKAESKS